MYQGFKKVLIIEPQSDAGRLVRDVVKELGAADAVITDGIKSAWQFLQTADAPPDWIISYADPDPRFNLFHLMRLLIVDESFINTRFSMLVTDEDKELLPLAFDMGLLSYHKKPFTKITLKAELENMLKAMSPEADQHFTVATEYLRTLLNEREDFNGRVKLEKSLAAKFPKSTQYFLSLAEAQILAGKNEDARRTLGAAKHLGANLALGVKQLGDLLEPANGGEPSVAESFSIQSCLICDADSATTTHVTQALTSLGVKQVVGVSDGQAALDWLKANGEPSLMITEWKLAKVSGPALVQRVRQMNMIGLPIIVFSSLLKDKDRNLLKEVGVSASVRKPLVMEYLISEIVNVFQSERFSSSAAESERKIRQLLDVGKTQEAETLYVEFKKQTGIPKGMLLLVESTLNYHKGNYPEARNMAMEALKEKGEAVIILNLLSKIFLKMNDKPSALKCLNRAQEFSSDNLDRLVTMAETYADSGDATKAKEVIADAKRVDATNTMVMQAEAEISITVGETPNAKSIIGQLDSAQSLIANMNNRAVLLVTSGEVEKALELYKNALASLPDHLRNEKEAILYNASLAFAKVNKPQEAQKHLVELIKISENKTTAEKARSLLRRVELAIESKQAIKLNIAPEKPPVIATAADLPARPLGLHLKPGQLCLHGIYDASERYTEAVNKLLRASPTYNHKKMAVLKREKAS